MSHSPEVLFWLQVIASVGSFLSGVGIVLAGVGLVFLIRQTRASERSTTATAYQSIIALGNSVTDMFISRPELHRELFGHASDFAVVASDEAFAHPRRFYAALKWLDYFETVLISWPAIPENLRNPWKTYIRDQFSSSAYLSRIVLDTSWFGDDLVQLCRTAQKPETHGTVSQRTQARSLSSSRLYQSIRVARKARSLSRSRLRGP